MAENELTQLEKRLVGEEAFESCFGEGSWGHKATKFSWFDLLFNANDLPCHSDIAIVVTSWAGQLKWLRTTLTGYRKTGKFVILAYDIPFRVWDPDVSMDLNMPRAIHHILAHSTVFKHKTYGADKRTGWGWDFVYANAIIKMYPNIKYVYCTNGDCLLEKPEGFPELIKLLGEGDLMSGQSSGTIMHTAAVLYKVEAFNKIADYMMSRIRYPVFGSHSPEYILNDARHSLNLKETMAPKQPVYSLDGSMDWYAMENQDSTWKDILGFRNLQAELDFQWENGKMPLPIGYLDTYQNWLYFSTHEKASLVEFYKTGNAECLKLWWKPKEQA